ncbi:MAG: hypothetical protein EPO68_13750 [Planctomycetota bacterium]|nr:MAG: hypothetical protein EPO68_13750 [Planctomycetota bacterium]
MPTLRTLVALAALACPAVLRAQEFTVRWHGHVEYNQITTGALGAVHANDPVLITLRVDAANFVNSPTFPTRGYPAVAGTFAYQIGSVALGLQTPYPAVPPPMLVLRNDDPAVDGFLLSTNVDVPVGVPLDQTGIFGALQAYQMVTYGGTALSSLDVAAAVGTYDFTGLSVFGFAIQDGPFDPVGVIFDKLEIAPFAPSCGFAAYGAGASPVNTLLLNGVGSPKVGGLLRAVVPNAAQSGAFFALSAASANLPIFGGAVLVDPGLLFVFQAAPTGASGAGIAKAIPPDPALAGLEVFVQAAGLEPSFAQGIALSNGLKATLCP